MLGAVDNSLHFSHYNVVRNTGLGGRHRLFDLRPEPRVVGFRLFGGRELRLDGRELGHVGRIAGGGGGWKLGARSGMPDIVSQPDGVV